MIIPAIQTAFKRLSFFFTLRPEKCPLNLGLLDQGGFNVEIFSERDSNTTWRGTALLDTGNEGPNLVTEAAMRYVHAQPTGPKMKISSFDGEERMTGGEVELSFAGPNGRRYRESFHYIPEIDGGYDMILNHEFYTTVFDKVPRVFMIRKVKAKETKGMIILIFAM
jgi:hypothetical protein